MIFFYQISNKEPHLRCTSEIWTFRDKKVAQKGEGSIFASFRSRKSYRSASTDSFEALQNCQRGTVMISQVYIIPAYNQPHILVCTIQVYIRTAWNDFNDHSQNNALALVSRTDLRLKYQQLLFGLTTFCSFNQKSSTGYKVKGTKVPKYLSTQVAKYPGSQVKGNWMQGHLPQIHSCHS